MHVVTGDFLKQDADIYVCTSNGVVIVSGSRPRLVMGRGAARSMQTMFKDCPERFATEISAHHKPVSRDTHEALYNYGGAAYYCRNGVTLGIFQTKLHWKAPSKMEIIRDATDWWLEHAKLYPSQQISMNFPGIGLGGLDERVVLPVISVLPDNVTVCKL